MRVWDALAEILRREGVEYVFNFPSHPVIDAGASLGIRPIVCRQERVGVGMADGYSRANQGRKIGVFAMQAGPGAENAFSGVACAFADSSPVLVLPTGQLVADAQVFPFFTAAKAYGPVTKSLELLLSPGTTVDVMRRAFSALRNGRHGPAMVEIPRDVGNMEVPDGLLDAYQPVIPVRAAGDPDAVEPAARALVKAKRPVILAGQGVLYAEATDELLELAELLAVPVVTTLEGIGAFPEDHPLSLGSHTLTMRGGAPELLTAADLVAGVGTSLTRGDLTPAIPGMPKTIIHVTNDPKDLNKCYFADHPVHGDAKLVLAQLVEACRDLLGGTPRPRAEVEAEIHSHRAAWLDLWMPKLTSDEVPLTPYRVVWDFVRTVDPTETIVTNDCGHPRHQLTPFYSAAARGYVGWGKSHALGTGIGLIMGAKLARPDRLCVHFMGDAAFGMTGLDVETAARNGIAALFVIFNNGGMATETKSLVVSEEKYGARRLGGRYAQVAEGLGLYAERVETPGEIVGAFARAREATEGGQPALLEFVTCNERELSHPSLTSAGNTSAARTT